MPDPDPAISGAGSVLAVSRSGLRLKIHGHGSVQALPTGYGSRVGDPKQYKLEHYKNSKKCLICFVFLYFFINLSVFDMVVAQIVSANAEHRTGEVQGSEDMVL